MVWNLICGIIAVISIGLFILYRREVRSIARQIDYIYNHDTNKIIARQWNTKEVILLTDKLNELLLKYRQDMQEYSRKDKQLKETITNLSHDIRTPLTSLDGYFQLLQECEAEEKRLQYTQIIDTRIDSLKEILEQLFTFVKLQNGDYEIELSPCNTNQILCEALFSFYEELKRKGMEPTVDIPEELCYSIGHEASLKRVIQNILKNALDHGEGMLKVRMVEEKRNIEIQISNYLKEDKVEVEKVFERFYQADEARGNNSTGLGLSIAKELVLRMGGTIEALTEGKEFGIRIELRKSEVL